MNSPLISCIVPVFNGERFLKEALDSVLAQTYRALELIVVDDGSTDGTAGVAAEFAGRLTYIRQRNQGPEAARNTGIERAGGEFVAFLDADDVWHEEKLARQLAVFETKPETDLCLTYWQNFWVPELADEERNYEGHLLKQPFSGFMDGALLARRAVFDKVGRFDTRVRITASVWYLRALERGAVLELLPDVLLYRRIHEDNITRRDNQLCMNGFLEFVKGYLDYKRRNDTRELLRVFGPRPDPDE